MTGHGKPQPRWNLEVDSFSRCRNIKMEPQILGSFPSTRPRPVFARRVILWCVSNLKLLASGIVYILKGDLHILGSSPSPGPRYFFICVWFYAAKCQIWSRLFSNCRNIEEEPPNLGSPFFALGVILWWDLANPSCMQNLKLLASAVAQILEEKPQILGKSPIPGPLFLWYDFMMNLGKP